MKLLKKIWHAVVPEKVREFLWFLRCPDKKKWLADKQKAKENAEKDRIALEKFREEIDGGTADKKFIGEMNFMLERGKCDFIPYAWRTDEYKPEEIQVFKDNKKNLQYVLHTVAWGGVGQRNYTSLAIIRLRKSRAIMFRS